MITLLSIFAKYILKVTSIFTIGSIFGILALDKLFGGYEFYLGMLIFIGPLIAWTVTFRLVPKNLDWLMSLPIAKRKIVALHYITSIVSTAIISLASVFIIVVLSLLKMDKQVTLEALAKAGTSSAVQAELKAQLGNYGTGTDIYSWMTALLLITMFHGLSMSVSRPSLTGRFYFNLWNHANPALRWGIRVGWIAVIGLAAIFRSHVLSPFGVFIMATFAFLLFPTFNTSQALAIPKRQRTHWVGVAVVLALIQISFMFQQALHGLSSEDSDQRVASVMFLGPFSKGASKTDIAKLIESDIDPERVAELSNYYKEKYGKGKRIKPTVDSDINFARAITSKKSFKAVINTLALFDSSDLRIDDLRTLFGVLAPLLSECHCEYRGYDLMTAKINPDQARELLAMKNDAATPFILTWARYHRSPEIAASIRHDLGSYRDKIKLQALETLSILDGRLYTFNDWIKETTGRKISSKPLEMDCNSWKIKSITEIKAEDTPKLNICIRQRADLTRVSEIENLGWIEPPFETRTQSLIKKILKIK